MKLDKTIKTVLVWLPSIIVSIFYINNALEKILHSSQIDKVITSSPLIMVIGLILSVATVLFLINKTVIYGTTILALYMTFTVFIHIYKEKPFEVAMLIVICTIFAAFLRRRDLFDQNEV